MVAVVANEVIDCSNPKIDVFIRKQGLLIDPAILEYQIFDLIGGPPGTQIFPATPGQRALVNLAPCPTGERISLGHFVALYSVPNTVGVGSHRIKWFFSETIGGRAFSFEEEFEVCAVAPPPSGPYYITVQDVRDAGIDATIASNTEIETQLNINQQFIDRATRQWFDSRALTLVLDGNTSDTLYLPVPIISVSSLAINDSENVLDPDRYRVYNGRDLPDDRWNPRIKLRRGSVHLFQDPFRSDHPPLFRKGRHNQTVVGEFGFTEADGGTPELIKRCLLLLVIEKLANPPFGSSAPGVARGPVGNVLRETTDGHTVQFTFVKFGDTRAGWSGYTMNREVHIILGMYKAPIGIAAPSARWLV